MKTLSWICIGIGLVILVIGLPLLIVNGSVLVGKAVFVALFSIVSGWIMLAKSKNKQCPYCMTTFDKNINFCMKCGVKL